MEPEVLRKSRVQSDSGSERLKQFEKAKGLNTDLRVITRKEIAQRDWNCGLSLAELTDGSGSKTIERASTHSIGDGVVSTIPTMMKIPRMLQLVVLCMGASVVPPLQAEDEPATKDLVTPEMTLEEPGAGLRVRQIAPEYESTAVYHALYLPTDWKPGGKFPVIVEYTGNKHPACGSTGEVKDANLGYGLSGGEGYIWVSMPYLEKGGDKNAVTWWGDRAATVEYCKTNLPRICAEFGGDPERVLICGFSRGAIATSYIGLADDGIASLWKAVFTHDHFDGDTPWGYPESDRKSAMVRLGRLKGRPVLAGGSANEFLRRHPGLAEFTFLRPPVAEIFDIPDGKVIHPHTDLWMHRESEYRDQAREWLSKAMAREAAGEGGGGTE